MLVEGCGTAGWGPRLSGSIETFTVGSGMGAVVNVAGTPLTPSRGLMTSGEV